MEIKQHTQICIRKAVFGTGQDNCNLLLSSDSCQVRTTTKPFSSFAPALAAAPAPAQALEVGHWVSIVRWIKSQSLPEGTKRDSFAPSPWGSPSTSHSSKVAPWWRRVEARLHLHAASPSFRLKLRGKSQGRFFTRTRQPFPKPPSKKMRCHFPDPQQCSKILPL